MRATTSSQLSDFARSSNVPWLKRVRTLASRTCFWSPGERTCTRRWLSRGNEKAFDLTQFVHWCCALGDARNSIVHGEAGTSLAYDELDSPYRGPFVEIGYRVVREAIAVLLGECGFPAVWRQGLARGHLQMYRALRQLDAEETADEGTGAPKDQGPVE